MSKLHNETRDLRVRLRSHVSSTRIKPEAQLVDALEILVHCGPYGVTPPMAKWVAKWVASG